MKKIIVFGSIILSGFLIWYFFVKPYDYLVTFKANTFPGAINQSIKTWNLSLEGARIENSGDILEITQYIPFNDSTFLYDWKITSITDTTSVVKVYVTDVDHSIANRFKHPFFDTDFEKRVKNNLTEFTEKLNDHISRFKVKIEGTAEINEMSCACISVSSSQVEKALGMMKNYAILSSELLGNKIELNGRPFVLVNQWDMKTDHLEYDFCYPIQKTDSLFEHPNIKLKQVKSQKALKAIYNGNYISSDRAWYALLDYADKNNIKIIPQPLEIFHNNPNMGGDELQWTTEVLMPLDLD